MNNKLRALIHRRQQDLKFELSSILDQIEYHKDFVAKGEVRKQRIEMDIQELEDVLNESNG